VPVNFVTSRCVFVLFGTSMSEYVLLNALRTAANQFDAKYCSIMNTRSAREYSMFTPAQLLRNRREQRPSKQLNLDSSITGYVRVVYYTALDLLLI
jgi:hypothetical protein